MVRSPPAIPDQGTPHATSHASRQWPVGGDDAEKDGAADGTSAYVPQQDTYDLFDMPAPPSLKQRSGNRYEDGEAISTWPAPSAAWVRTGKPIDNPVRPGSDGRQNMTPANLNAGLDGIFFDSDAGILIGSFSTRYQPGDARLFPPHGISKIYPDDYRFAGTLTWFGAAGFYLDAQAELSWTVNDVATDVNQRCNGTPFRRPKGTPPLGCTRRSARAGPEPSI
ncbi:hypothetical protein TM49_11705 [Martelella endophytica]|uniref:Uncharacterized protein n=2 Tax=Martelella endophytica TaxID=1486262 RepID=A0A0D5LQF9_MAREN|nr:hypothetical protein TM49_11705 [Martelella endophytica]